MSSALWPLGLCGRSPGTLSIALTDCTISHSRSVAAKLIHMCGICGTFNFDTEAPTSTGVLRRMTATLTHRGPDEEGYFVRGPLGFGFRRLSIIDIEGGQQPMSDSEHSVWVVFNGEIYNFRELKSELEAYGHTFRTRSDTEVIIYAYKQWGRECLQHLNGMFGLALWDSRENVLILARDRLGIKPVYYRITSKNIIFGSEIRAVIAGDPQKPSIDTNAVNAFLRYRYTPAPLTAIAGVRKLAAGTRLIVERGSARVERWWNFRPTPFDPAPTVQYAEQQLLDLYRRAVKRQLVSDVPVGLLLSGGMDSGLLLALMSADAAAPWNTYTAGFGDALSGDEITTAGETARHFGSYNVPVELTRADFDRALPQVISSVEEPIASDSIVPMYFLCQRARQDVKVALMGQGPDELFGGYRRHLAVQYGSYTRALPRSIQPLIASVLNRRFDRTAVSRFVASIGEQDRLTRYRNVFSLIPGATVDTLFRQGCLDSDVRSDIFDCWSDLTPLMSGTDELGGLQFLELRSSLPDELLLYADKLSMASGLEVRVPYLDHDIVEYVERLSASFKVHHGSRKWLHRRVCRQLLPGQIIKRRKLGFETPSGDWFRDSDTQLSEYLNDTCSRMYDVLEYEAVQRLVNAHRSGRQNYSDTLFSLAALELWFRNF